MILTNNKRDLQLLDAISDGDELAATPHQSLLFNTPHRFLQLDHISFVVPRFDFQRNDRLPNMPSALSLGLSR